MVMAASCCRDVFLFIYLFLFRINRDWKTVNIDGQMAGTKYGTICEGKPVLVCQRFETEVEIYFLAGQCKEVDGNQVHLFCYYFYVHVSHFIKGFFYSPSS